MASKKGISWELVRIVGDISLIVMLTCIYIFRVILHLETSDAGNQR